MTRTALTTRGRRALWGADRKLEARLLAELGPECFDSVLHASYGVRVPVPVYGLPVAAVDGLLLPRVAGGMGFTGLSDLWAEATGGKQQQLRVQKTGVAAPAAAATQHLWGQGTLPAAGANAGGTTAGTIPTNASTGALGQANANSGDTLHFVGGDCTSTVAGAVLMYDYLFGVNINHATTANTVTGVPTRYQNTAQTTSGVPNFDWIGGNWISGRVTTVLGATAHNVTVTYQDQANNAAEAAAAVAVRVSSAVQTTPLTQPQWTIPLNSPDVGAKNITSIALSAASTGNVGWIIGHSLVIFPAPIANQASVLDGINSAFNPVRVADGACLAFAEFSKAATTAATVDLNVRLVSG